jgi:hypothetical protein
MSSSSSSYRGGRGGGGRGGRGGGRGSYYRNKYGGGRGGRGRKSNDDNDNPPRRSTGGGTYQELKALLSQIDGKQYPSYHALETSTVRRNGTGWRHPFGFTLQIGRTQSDPFAPPTRCRVLLPAQLVRLPPDLCQDKIGRLAIADSLWRQLYEACLRRGAHQSLQQQSQSQSQSQQGTSTSWSGPKGGDVRVATPTQHVLEQSAVQVYEGGAVSVQLAICLPARGRSILGHEAAHVLESVLGALMQDIFLSIPLQDLWDHVQSIRDQKYVQDQLTAAGLVAFVRNGAILPRRSGADDRPMLKEGCIPFVSPRALEREFKLPNTQQSIIGMGIPVGVTLICGGGFHGKSTLLQTLQVGVYFKVPGDGREFCVTVPSAAKIRAEDGRYVQSFIHSFIHSFIRVQRIIRAQRLTVWVFLLSFFLSFCVVVTIDYYIQEYYSGGYLSFYQELALWQGHHLLFDTGCEWQYQSGQYYCRGTCVRTTVGCFPVLVVVGIGRRCIFAVEP